MYVDTRGPRVGVRPVEVALVLMIIEIMEYNLALALVIEVIIIMIIAEVPA